VKSRIREKDKYIFQLIVDEYILSGKPVGSAVIAQKSRIPVSPATVRNIMAKLEREGYLEKPHHSAGRIPTDKGLRLYVNQLYDQVLTPEEFLELPPGSFAVEQGDFNKLLQNVSQLLSAYSDNIGFVISPSLARVLFKHVRFIRISEKKFMLILVTTFNLILTEIIESTVDMTQFELDRASRFIEENFAGKNLIYVHNYLQKEFPRFRVRFEDVLQKLSLLLRVYTLQEDESKKIYLEGTAKLISKVNLFDLKRLQALFQKFEERAKLAQLLSDLINLDRVRVLIGTELDVPDIADCSLILSHYGSEEQVLGSLGIIGPKRIPYRKVIPLVEYVARRLSQTFRITH